MFHHNKSVISKKIQICAVTQGCSVQISSSFLCCSNKKSISHSCRCWLKSTWEDVGSFYHCCFQLSAFSSAKVKIYSFFFFFIFITFILHRMLWFSFDTKAFYALPFISVPREGLITDDFRRTFLFCWRENGFYLRSLSTSMNYLSAAAFIF